ncbi:acyltransferase [Clostridium sp.]|uniref:acyltransferase family protein n=1 Tax=Clostridium sp. TaxID=1506 RepID=UPI00284A2E56|nr:acyltransferase [Clostridium sp.]MDR3595082.1 acyltransferase [Clostridium sp.]
MIYTLTALRFVAAVAIYLHHLSYPGGLGTICVTFFFVMSGFTMAYGYRDKFVELNKHNLKKFYFKRLLRIYPLYILTFLFSIPIMYYTNFKTSTFYSLINILMLQSYFPNGVQVFSYNGVSWFIADVVLFYMLTPFCMYLLHKYKIKSNMRFLVALQLSIFFIAAFIAYNFRGKMEPYTFGWWFIYISPFFRLFDYIIGFLAGIIFTNLKNITFTYIKDRILFTALEFASLMFLVYSYHSSFLGFDSLKYGIYFIPASIFIVFIFSFQKGLVSFIISNKILIYLGNLSLPIFLIHQLAISYTSVFFTASIYGYSHEIKHLISQLLLFIVIIFLSDVVHRYYEEPVKNNLTKVKKSISI